jgi:hypothetical protein
MVDEVAIVRPFDRTMPRKRAIERIAEPIEKQAANDQDEKIRSTSDSR